MEGTPTNETPGKTPSRTPLNRSAVHTPLDRSASRDLRNSVRRGTSASGGPRAGNNNAPTPHAKAARRLLNERRTAMFTPGKNRRRSQMEQRETPMDILRRLGSRLAPTSKPISSSSSSASADTPPQQQERDRSSGFASIREEGDSPSPPRPRFSLPIDQEDDDDGDLPPPRLSDITLKSVEFPRRFDPDQRSQFPRESMGGIPDSDAFGNNEPAEGTGRPSDFFPEALQQTATAGDELIRVDDEPARPSLDRDLSFGLDMPTLNDPSETFRFSPPPIDEAPTEPIVDDGVPDDAAIDATPSMGNISDIETIEDISDRSDEGGVDIEVTAPQQRDEPPVTRREAMPPRKKNRISRHGIEYPSLPPAFVKKVAQTALQSSGLSNPRISADTLTALTQASDWFFEQLGDDLGAYAQHAKRKTVEESDVVTLMRRQRQISSTSTMFSLAQKHLPRELLQELRMPLPQTTKKRREKRRRDDDEGEEIT